MFIELDDTKNLLNLRYVCDCTNEDNVVIYTMTNGSIIKEVLADITEATNRVNEVKATQASGGGSQPTGTMNIVNNGIYNVSSYASANVNVPSEEPNLQSKDITITTNGTQTIEPDTGYDGLSDIDITVDVPSDERMVADLNRLKSQLPYAEATGENITLEDTQELQLKNIQIQGNSIPYIKLPDEYQQVEYIESHGQEYIDTGYIPNQDTGFYIDFIPENTPTSSNAPNYFNAGGSGGQSNRRFGINLYSSSPSSVSGEMQIFTIRKDPKITKDSRMKMSVINGTITYNDGTTEDISVSSITASNSLVIFGAHNNPVDRLSTMKLYSFILYEGTTLIHHYFPCYRKNDNEIGLYDIIDRQFLANSGTGDFVKGQNVLPQHEAGVYSVTRDVSVTISSDNIEDETQTVTFPLLEGQKLSRRTDTEYDYLSDDGIVNVLEQVDYTGYKTLEDSFIVMQEPIITPYTEEQQEAYNRIKGAHSYEDTTHINSNGDINSYIKVTAYTKNVIRPKSISFQDSTESSLNLNVIEGTNLISLQNTFRDCKNITDIDLSNINLVNITSIREMCSGATNLKSFKIGDTSNLTEMYRAFFNCNNLENISKLDTSSVTGMQLTFSGCTNLSNESLNNILYMCAHATDYINQGTNMTLAYIGLTSAQATICQTLSNWQAFVNAGWSSGY